MSDRSLRYVPKSAITVVDLFAGCGGLTLGFHRAGLDSVAAVENNRFAAATYRENFPDAEMHCGDIQTWASGVLPKADVIIGGPPCQGFSNLNRKSKDEPDVRNKLWSTYVDVVTKIRPKIFLLENVDRFSRSAELASLLQEQEQGGRLDAYEIRFAVVRATDFGAAQLRRRTIVIGTRKDLPTLEIPSGNGKPAKTVWQVISEIGQHVSDLHVDLPAGRLAEFPEGYAQGPFRTDELHLTRNYEAKSIERFKSIPPGGNRFDLPDRLKSPCWIKHETGAADVMGRLHWHRPSVTIRTEFFKPEKGRYLHPTENRALTHREAALLQGFPDAFRWYGSKVEIARQIGNAVPVELAEALGRHIAKHLRKHSSEAASRRLPSSAHPLKSVLRHSPGTIAGSLAAATR